MKALVLIPFVASAILSLTPVCSAQTQVWDLDKSHSSINFGVDHLVISETKGKFDEFGLAVKSDKADFTDAKFDVTIQAKSINTNDAKRDEHLRAPDFFNVEKHPTIRLEGKKFEKLKNNVYKVYGKLTLNGVTKDVVWDAKFNGIVKDPWGGTRAGLKITGTVDRYDYNLKYNSVLEGGGLAIGKEVRLDASLELVKKPNA
jgi:polyisoprenoid-binding protein YceI